MYLFLIMVLLPKQINYQKQIFRTILIQTKIIHLFQLQLMYMDFYLGNRRSFCMI